MRPVNSNSEHMTLDQPEAIDPRIEEMEDHLSRVKDITVIDKKASADSQYALLKYKVLLNSVSKSILLIKLETGRKHQIRAQLSGRGFFIAGDVKYGASGKLSDKIMLHSVYLSFKHPTLKEKINIYSAPGNRFNKLLNVNDEQLKNAVIGSVSAIN